MSLADKIIKLRKEQGWSQEDLASRLGVTRQSVSKWESMSSVPDLDKIVKMSELFQVSTDYLLKETVLIETEADGDSPDEPHPAARPVSLKEANFYLELAPRCHRNIALAVSLFILSPICLLLLSGAAEYRIFPMGETTAVAIGCSALFLVVTGGVALLLPSCLRLAPYEYLELEPISTEYSVAGIVQAQKESFAPQYQQGLVAGVSLCIVSVVPLFLSYLVENEFYSVCAICLMLAILSVGVHILLRFLATQESYQKLLEEGDYTRAKKAENRRNASFVVFYWCFSTAIYLAVSFYTESWNRTWIVWPVASVLFAALLALKEMLHKGGSSKI